MSQQTLIDAIKQDHHEIKSYYKQYVDASGNADAQERWARQLTWEIARHSIGEELVVYPMLESSLGEKGTKIADHDRADHQAVKERLYRLESLNPGTPEHADLLKDIMDHLNEHIKSEEGEDFPALESAIGKEASMAAASKFTRTKKFVPTRSHPSAPDKPPFETVVGLMAAPLDKLKDAFSKFPTEEMIEQANM
ncbi:hypothetical protein D9615_002526 [Tricholomella constricta]|uniref:Hemerythrin-like domain-containing protein n=1 Tax=Tricholomella constricta TaxID=117010 RepID=A0A8H5MA09_9AGAR|nr:hypothetical protein D9615_002526 [Tricholomella constricta]